MKITILGAGSAYGCPMCFNSWGKSSPQDKRNIRSRASILIETGERRFIIDAGPDFRSQVNQHNVPDVDAIFLTHGHYDHIAGVPELPRASKLLKHPVEVWASHETMAELKNCYGYLFKGEEPESVGLCWKSLPDLGEFESFSQVFKTFQVPHHHWHSSAFRCGDFAYVTDWEELPQTALSVLKGVKLLLIECNNGLYPEKNGHSDLFKVKQYMELLKPERVVLTHLSARVDYEETSKELPSGYELAYDGMILDV